MPARDQRARRAALLERARPPRRWADEELDARGVRRRRADDAADDAAPPITAMFGCTPSAVPRSIVDGQRTGRRDCRR